MLGHRLGFLRTRILGAALAGTLALFAGLTGAPVPAAADPGLQLYVGYADNLRPNPAAFPTPFGPSSSVIFEGDGSIGHYDSGALRIDNSSAGVIQINHVTVLNHGHLYDLWHPHNVGPGQTLIMAQTNGENFDTSEPGIKPCGVWAGPNEDPPQITITYTVNGTPTTQTFVDHGHVLDTHGYDVACDGSNESIPWTQIGDVPVEQAHLTLSPPAQSSMTGAFASVQATFLAGSTPQSNALVNFWVEAGPNTGMSGSALTDLSGHATFAYTSAVTGLDTVRASVSNPAGIINSDNGVTIFWLPAVCTVPPTVGMISPVTGSSYGTGDTVPIRFTYTDCHGAMVRDESVIVEVYDMANLMYPVTTHVYGYDVIIDPAGVYSVDFMPAMYGVAPGTHLMVNVWFGSTLAGQAWFDVH
jgi:hypothetical protein